MKNLKKKNWQRSYLESVFLVLDLQIEADGLLEGNLSLALLVSPLVADQRVTDNSLKIGNYNLRILLKNPENFRFRWVVFIFWRAGTFSFFNTFHSIKM